VPRSRSLYDVTEAKFGVFGNGPEFSTVFSTGIEIQMRESDVATVDK